GGIPPPPARHGPSERARADDAARLPADRAADAARPRHGGHSGADRGGDASARAHVPDPRLARRPLPTAAGPLLGLLPEQRPADLPDLLPGRPRLAEHGRELDGLPAAPGGAPPPARRARPPALAVRAARPPRRRVPAASPRARPERGRTGDRA